MKFKKILLILLITCLIITPLGCGRKGQDDINNTEPIIIIEEKDKVEEIDRGLGINPLTGLLIDEQFIDKRPVAVMINNLKAALPQSGISQADVIYETLAEGNITRMVALFQYPRVEKIGPIRSTRHYYIDLALDHDAIFVHHGGSPQAFEAIKTLQPASINSLSYLENTMAWRDPLRSKKRGMYEHSLYTSSEGIERAWKKLAYREERARDLNLKFNFNDEEDTPRGDRAEIIVVPFSNEYTSTFKYNQESKLYERFQFGEPHIDENNGDQIRVKNIIIQYANIKHIPGDPEGRRNIDLVDSGNGLYISNKKAVPIIWEKRGHKIPTEYRDAYGNILKINKGKTWVCIFPKDKNVILKEFEESGVGE